MSTEHRPDLSTVKPAKKESLSGQSAKVFENCLDCSQNVSSRVESMKDGVYYIDDVLSSEECLSLCNEIDNNESLSFWSKGDNEKQEFRMFRNADTIEVDSESIVSNIWQRVQSILSFLRLRVRDEDNDENYERELVGDWEPIGLSPHMLFAKYPSMGAFAPHTDGRTILDFNKRSFYSVIIFLNDIPLEKGGGTRFYQDIAVKKLTEISVDGVPFWSADSSLIECEVEAVRGRMLVFHQSLVHEGVPPVSPYLKYIIRSDVMLQRQEPICNSENDIEAYKLFREAEDLAESGEVDRSVALFRKAFKLSPAMASIMGQA